ncbi:MAG TPA: hypothetical protein ENG05_03485, partial [Acidilobales archaeon]|nr:hypothetical protein [Acidilobales archaeon]
MRKAAYLLILTLTLMIIATLTPITIADDPGRIIRVPEDVKSVRKAVAMAGPGDTVVISEGIYREFLYIDNKENLTVIGRGNVTLDINLRNRFVIYVRNSRNIVIKGLGTLRARESNIIIENSHNITLENITSSSTYQAIFITRSNHVVLKNVIANHSLEGIIIESSKNCVIINAYIYDIGFTSIDISKSSNIVIDGVRINKSLSITIGGSSNITIKNSLIKAFRKPKIVPDIHFISGIENVTIEDTVLLGGGLRFELPTSILNVDLRNVTFKNLPIALLRNRDFGWRSLR